VPVILLEHLTETQRRALILADNKLALNAGWDEELLAVELGELKDLQFNLDLTGFDPGEIEGLLADAVAEPATDDPDEAEPDGSEPARTKLGEVWRLGPHRLLVGDSTDAPLVGGLLDVGPKLQIVDPPFDLDYRAWVLQPSADIVMVWQRGGSAIVWEAGRFGASGEGEWGSHELIFTGGVRGWPCDWFPCTVHDVVRMWRSKRAASNFFAAPAAAPSRMAPVPSPSRSMPAGCSQAMAG
jgi:hypothetical protein